MRLKSSDGPITIHNVYNDVLNSPKRINTVQNSNITSNLTTNSSLTFNNTTAFDNEDTLTELTTADIRNLDTLNNVQNELIRVQWCKSTPDKRREILSNNVNNQQLQQRNHLVNINNTLAASLRNTSNIQTIKRDKSGSIYSESSPDDSYQDYEGAYDESGTSADSSPQDEDRGFDISDSESLSEDGNLNQRKRSKTIIQRRGIVNPNYPGFQHFAHTLDYTIRVSSDTDFTDDDYECEVVSAENRKQSSEENDDFNNINNNNVEETEDAPIDKIDSVNRLDSVENIQKVFYDKPVLNLDCENLNQNFSDLESNSNNSNQVSDEDTAEKLPFQKIEVKLNIKAEEVACESEDLDEEARENTRKLTEPTHQYSEVALVENIVGDFEKEIEHEFGRIASENKSTDKCFDNFKLDLEINFEPSWEQTIVRSVEEAIEKLTELLDFAPTAQKYEIEPNIGEPFIKQPPNEIKISKAVIVEHSELLSEQPHELFQSPIAQQFKLEEKLETDVLSTSYVENVTNALNDSKMVKPEEMDSFQNKLPDEETNIITRMKSRISEKMEVESEINELKRDSNRQLEEIEFQIKKMKSDTSLSPKSEEEVEKFCKEDIAKHSKEKENDTIDSKIVKNEETNVKRRKDYGYKQCGSLMQLSRKDEKRVTNRKSFPSAIEMRKKNSNDQLGSFDVYNIETAIPKIDLEAIELHLKAARAEERRRRTDREEIRRRLAMGNDDEYYSDRPGRKPSLQSRLQSGMNLQICFMNEALSDTESPSSDSECPLTNPKQPKTTSKTTKEEKSVAPPQRPASLSLGEPLKQPHHESTGETDFFTKQARLQTEARMALAQAKEMARMQMEIEKQKQKKSPITEMVRHSLEKIGIPFPEDKRRLSRQILTEMNVAQLQVIVNDLHTQIETLNENLVKFLMDRDDLHMEQDSMLVDIEDLTRYLGDKEQIFKEQSFNILPTSNNNNSISPPSPAPPSPLTSLNNSMKPHLHRISSLMKK